MLDQILYQRMFSIENQGLIDRHITHRHTAHRIHLHHVIHTTALLGDGQHRGDGGLCQLLKLYRQLVLLCCGTDLGFQILLLLVEGLLLILTYRCLELLTEIGIDSAEVNALILRLELRDERLIDALRQDDGILTCILKHRDVLTLLNRVGDIVDDLVLFRLVTVFCRLRCIFRGSSRLVCSAVLSIGLLCGFVDVTLLDLEALRQGEELTVDVLEEDVIGHLLTELVVAEAAILDEWCDIVPVLLVVLTIGLAEAGELISDLLRDVILDLLYEAVVLELGSRYVQRQIRTVDDTL